MLFLAPSKKYIWLLYQLPQRPSAVLAAKRINGSSVGAPIYIHVGGAAERLLAGRLAYTQLETKYSKCVPAELRRSWSYKHAFKAAVAIQGQGQLRIHGCQSLDCPCSLCLFFFLAPSCFLLPTPSLPPCSCLPASSSCLLPHPPCWFRGKPHAHPLNRHGHHEDLIAGLAGLQDNITVSILECHAGRRGEIKFLPTTAWLHRKAVWPSSQLDSVWLTLSLSYGGISRHKRACGKALLPNAHSER